MTRASTAADDRVIASVNRPEAGQAPDRPDLSAVRPSLLPEEAAREIFMAMQGDDAS
jgi:hypothetical protein